MNNEQHGTIEQVSSFSWKVEIPSTLTLPNSMQQWTSSYFSCLKSSQNFCMAIIWTGNKTLSGNLYVFEGVKGVPDTQDFLIVLKYKHKQEIFTKENVKPVKNKDWFQYDLEAVNIDNLLKITCTIFNRDASSGTIFGSGKIEFVEKEADSEKRKHEEETISTEQSQKLNGELALADDLENIFLDEEESDIILKVGDKSFPAHKIIIRARSPVFYAMLKHDMKEKEESVVDIEDCDPSIFHEFLHYVYSAKLDNLTENIVFELYHIADKYDVKELRIMCLDFIRSHLNVDMICDAISLALKHCENDLLTQATKFFIDNVHDIITTVNWQKFHKENPISANELFIKTVNQKILKKET